MKVIRKNENSRVKFSELKPGDTFIDTDKYCEYNPEMRIEYGDISYQFSETGESSSGFASVSLTTGNIFFYDNDFYVIPIKLNAVEE